MELIDYFDRGWALDPNADCMVMQGRRWTYSAVRQRTLRIAAALRRDGWSEGAKVAVLAPNDPEAFICVLGALRARAIWLPVNARYSMGDVIGVLNDFDCDVLFLHSSFSKDLARITAEVPRLAQIIGIDAEFGGKPDVESWLAEIPPDFKLAAPASHEDVVVIMATGGTTGRPKGVMQTNRGFATYIANHLATFWELGAPRYLMVAPMTHAAGFMCFPMFARGGTVFVLDGAKPPAIANAINEYRITDLFLPPTLIYLMLNDPAVRAMRFPSLKYLLYGAAPISVEKLRQALEWLGPVLIQGFGQVEALMLCTVMRPEDHYSQNAIAGDSRLSSCGRPAPFVSLAVMGPNGDLLEADQVGEVVVRSGNVMKGYYKNEAATAEASRFGWHHTGDIGYRDQEGFYHLMDRAKDLIISGGFNIYPSEIEQVLSTHPAVFDVVVIGVPHEKWGEAVTAVVQLKPGELVQPDVLIALCRDRLGSVKAPKAVHFWPELPRSPVGKVLKREVRDSFWGKNPRRIA